MGVRVSHENGALRLEGYLAARASPHDCPGVLIVPSWLTSMIPSATARIDWRRRATAFVVDLFGAGVQPHPPQPPMEVLEPLLRTASGLASDYLRVSRTFVAARTVTPIASPPLGTASGAAASSNWPLLAHPCGESSPYTAF